MFLYHALFHPLSMTVEKLEPNNGSFGSFVDKKERNDQGLVFKVLSIWFCDEILYLLD